MTPRQKANQLFNRYQDEVGMFKFDAKHSALIAVEEIIESLEVLENTIDKIDNVNLSIFSAISYQIEYWKDVEQKINEL